MPDSSNRPSELSRQLFASPQLSWLNACQDLELRGEAYCIATVVAEVGSVPRSRGAKMVISASHQFDTLGGGNLEYQVIQKARAGLKQQQSQTSIERFSLAADLGQCCGGAVQVLLEFMQTRQPKVVVFGAGHVCHSLAAILGDLPCHLTVVDSRAEWLEPLSAMGITTRLATEPSDVVEQLPADAHLVVMTQDHALDFAITRKALERNCFRFIGLIGSEGKKQRFTYRLQEQLSDAALLAGLTCPIGHPDIRGKLPMQVAVSIAAQLIRLFEQAETENNNPQQAEQSWQDANSLRKNLTEVKQ
jgi:xanthine dehydrogenase accessory factor